MANQRIYIRCKACGGEKFLAKRRMDAFYTVAGDGWPLSWDQWFEDHVWGFCGDAAEGLDIFELVYEHTNEEGNPSGA